MSGYGYATGGMAGFFLYIGILAVLFLYSCIASKDCFTKKCFLFITYFGLFTILDNLLKLTIKIASPASPFVKICLAKSA